MEKNIKIGIDLGGSHVNIGVVNEMGKIIEQHEKDFTIEEKKNLINVAIVYIIENINKLKEKYQFTKVGLGIAGAIADGVIVKSVNLGIFNFNIKEKIENKTGITVVTKNDAKCAAIGEYKYSDLNKYENVLFLTLGTGIGGAYIYNRKLMEGNKFEGTEFGHIIIEKNGLQCNCGKKGCFEKYGSILTFKNKIIERLGLSYDISGPELRNEISKAKDNVLDIIDEYLDNLSIGLSNLINIFEPDCIVLGGGFARYDYLLLDGLKKKILNSNLLFNETDDIELQVATLGNEAGVIGASLL